MKNISFAILLACKCWIPNAVLHRFSILKKYEAKSKITFERTRTIKKMKYIVGKDK